METLEEIPSFLYPGLVRITAINRFRIKLYLFLPTFGQAQLEHKSGSEGKELMLKLVTWTLQCLDLDAARKMPIAVSQ